MRYLGGKERVANDLSAYLESVRKPGQPYLEPFVGGASVISRMSGVRYGSDACKALITMYRAMQNGWKPPPTIDAITYEQIKDIQDHDDPLTAFAAFACSFGGKWFSGYAWPSDRLCAPDGKRHSWTSLLRKMDACQDVVWSHRTFDTWAPFGWLVYCDPPYAGTVGYDGAPPWDPDKFWAWAKRMSARNTVLVSEYSAPKGWRVVWEVERNPNHRGLDANANGTVSRETERLYRFFG